MSDTNETEAPSDFTEAATLIKSYTEAVRYFGVDQAYSWVFEYYTHPSAKGQFTPEFVREVLDSLEESITTYGPAKAEVATLCKYL